MSDSTYSVSEKLYEGIERAKQQPIWVPLAVIVGLYWVVVVYYAITQAIPRPQLGIGFLGMSIIIYILMEANTANQKDNRLDLLFLFVLGSIALIFSSYFWMNYEAVNFSRIGWATMTDYIMALAALGTVTYLTYRAFGLPFVFVIGAALGYAYFGPYMPGLLHHTGLGWERILQISVTEIEGIYGNLTRITAAWIALFLLLAGLMQGYGAFDVMFRGAARIAGRFKSGIAQSAVIASMIIGSINGSATANTALSGSITIPLMKEHGITPETAAGIESVASNGGQIMPPIMGASAFLMASLLARPYSDILVAAIVPGLIYYFSVVVAVHFVSIQELDHDSEQSIEIEDEFEDIDTEDKVEELEVPISLQVIRFGVPIGLLVYLLAIAQFTIITSALWTVYTMVATGIGIPILYELYDSRSGRRTVHQIKESLMDTGRGLVIGAELLAPIAIVIAALNVIADLLLATGVPSKLTLALMELSGGIMILAILFAMILCIILGLGMPTIAAYLIVALLVAPSIINTFGVPELAAHFFVLYAANLSTITPPIAAGIVVATGIAQSNFWGTSLQAVKISAPIFVLPFVFIYNPSIVTANIGIQTIVSGSIAFAGAILLVYSLNNPFNQISGRIKRNAVRTIAVISGIIAMAYPGYFVRLTILFVGISALILLNGQRRDVIRQRLPF